MFHDILDALGIGPADRACLGLDFLDGTGPRIHFTVPCQAIDEHAGMAGHFPGHSGWAKALGAWPYRRLHPPHPGGAGPSVRTVFPHSFKNKIHAVRGAMATGIFGRPPRFGIAFAGRDGMMAGLAAPVIAGVVQW